MLFYNPYQKQIMERIKFGREDMSNKEIAKNIVEYWRGHEKITDMLTAQNYHFLRDTEIEKKNRSYIKPIQKEDGTYSEEKVENPTLSNIKIKNPFPRSSVEQKINYGFSKPFVFEVTQPDKEVETPELILYRDEWLKFLNDDTRDTIKQIATDGVINGIGWAYITLDENSELKIIDIRPETVYPEWLDRTHKQLDRLVREFTILSYTNGIPEEIHKIEFWNSGTAEFYIDDGGDWILDNDAETFILGDGERPPGDEGIPHLKIVGWGRVPFVAFKANANEMPLLNPIKDYIDTIDSLRSKLADILLDDLDAILAIEGVTSDFESLMRTRVNIKNSKIISVDIGGKIYYVKNDPNVDAILKSIEAYYKDMLQYSSTIDLQGDSRTIRQTQDALKTMYQPLNIYISGIETYFREFINNLKYFFDKSLEFRSIGTIEQWGEFEIHATLDRDIEINDAEVIDNLIKSQSMLSVETLDSQHPYVKDHKTEQARRDAEQETQLRQMDNFRNTLIDEGAL